MAKDLTESSRHVLPIPRFTNSTMKASYLPLPKTQTQTRHENSSSSRQKDAKGRRHKLSRAESSLSTLPAIRAYLSREYSEAQLDRVPPVFVSHLRDGGGVYLVEPYSVTLRKAVEREGEGVIVKPWGRKNSKDG